MIGIFSSIPDPKNAGTIHFMSGGWHESGIVEEFQQPAIQTKNCAALWQIFSPDKSVLTNRKKKFMQAARQRIRRLEAFLYLAAQNFKHLSKTRSKIKIKN